MSEKKGKTWKTNLKQKKWGEHKHCIVCGKAIPMNTDFCSQECRDKYQKVEKDKNKKNTWQIVVIFGIMIVMMFVLPYLG